MILPALLIGAAVAMMVFATFNEALHLLGGGLVLLAVAAAASIRPSLMIGISVMAAITSMSLVEGTEFTPYKVALSASGVLVITDWVRGGRPIAASWFIPGVFAMFVSWSVVSDLSAGEDTMDFVRAGGVLLLAVCINQFMRSMDDFHVLGLVLVGVACIIAFDAALEVGFGFLSARNAIRAEGLLGNANGTASAALAVSSVAVICLAPRTGLRRGLLLTVPPLILTLMVTVSRGASVAAVIWLATLAGAASRHWPTRIGGGIAVALVVAFAAVAAPDAVARRFGGTVVDDGGEQRIDDNSRTELNTIALQLISEEPIVGVGTFGFAKRAQAEIGMPFACHNHYLGAAAGYGLLGGLLASLYYLVPIFLNARRILRATEDERPTWAAAAGAGVAYAVFASTSPPAFPPWSLLVVMVPEVLARTLEYERSLALKHVATTAHRVEVETAPASPSPWAIDDLAQAAPARVAAGEPGGSTAQAGADHAPPSRKYQVEPTATWAVERWLPATAASAPGSLPPKKRS